MIAASSKEIINYMKCRTRKGQRGKSSHASKVKSIKRTLILFFSRGLVRFCVPYTKRGSFGQGRAPRYIVLRTFSDTSSPFQPVHCAACVRCPDRRRKFCSVRAGKMQEAQGTVRTVRVRSVPVLPKSERGALHFGLRLYHLPVPQGDVDEAGVDEQKPLSP